MSLVSKPSSTPYFTAGLLSVVCVSLSAVCIVRPGFSVGLFLAALALLVVGEILADVTLRFLSDRFPGSFTALSQSRIGAWLIRQGKNPAPRLVVSLAGYLTVVALSSGTVAGVYSTATVLPSLLGSAVYVFLRAFMLAKPVDQTPRIEA